MKDILNEITIMLAGKAGSGVQSAEMLLVSTIKNSGYNVFSTKEYMSRVRGGTNSITIRISENSVKNIKGKPDIFIPFDIDAYKRYINNIASQSVVIGDANILNAENIKNIPFNTFAQDVGNKLYAGMAIVGAVIGIIDADFDILSSYMSKIFAEKDSKIISDNIKVAELGYNAGKNIIKEIDHNIQIPKNSNLKNNIIVSGTESVALGALAGGCDSIFSYPMTPGSGVFTMLAGLADKCELVVEQSEDEIAAINMAIGAWYAGARALVSTSGGGFALMTEGLSLSGMTETPVVVHVAQRPGPATGLPTRTEQGDLNLAVYAGHGSFGRAIFAPGDITQGYELTRHAFDVADKYQAPVIILTDQYFTDTYYNIPEFTIYEPLKKHIVEAQEGYMRYKLGDAIIPLRSIPGFGVGRVCADSDEHDESGRITEDLDGISTSMKRRRLEKMKLLKDNSLPPDLYGDEDYDILFICWGSVLPIAKEALLQFSKKVALLHFTQVFPLNIKATDYLKKAKKIIAIENNQTAQFKKLIELEFGVKINSSVLKYNGLQLTADEIVKKINEVL